MIIGRHLAGEIITWIACGLHTPRTHKSANTDVIRLVITNIYSEYSQNMIIRFLLIHITRSRKAECLPNLWQWVGLSKTQTGGMVTWLYTHALSSPTNQQKQSKPRNWPPSQTNQPARSIAHERTCEYFPFQ